MNTTNILAVADAIEQHSIPDLGFNMRYYFGSVEEDHVPDLSGHNCGTTACIGGWANAVIGEARGWDIDFLGHDGAMDWLGLDDQQATNLFCAENYPRELKKANSNWFTLITPDQAVRTLRHLAATGNVDWTV